jgi:Uma2 family endonuclease
MKARPRHPATYEDVLRAPDHLIAELIDGELHTSPRPRPAHSRSILRLSARLARFEFGEDGDPGGWVFMIEPELHLGDDVLVPDICGWRVERLPETPQTAGVEVAPDWVCEVLSPSNSRHDRVVKMPAYARHGVAYAWTVDVTERSLEVYRLENGRWSLLAVHGDEPVAAEPFESLVLQPDDIYGPATASPAAP